MSTVSVSTFTQRSALRRRKGVLDPQESHDGSHDESEGAAQPPDQGFEVDQDEKPKLLGWP